MIKLINSLNVLNVLLLGITSPNMAIILSRIYASLISSECVKSEMGILRHDISIGLLFDELLRFCRDVTTESSSSSSSSSSRVTYSLALSTCIHLLECEYGKVSEYDLQTFLHHVFFIHSFKPSSMENLDSGRDEGLENANKSSNHGDNNNDDDDDEKWRVFKGMIPSFVGLLPSVIAPSLHPSLLSSLTSFLTQLSSSSSSSSSSITTPTTTTAPTSYPYLTGILYQSLAMIVSTAGEALSTSGEQFLPALFAALLDSSLFVRQSAERFGFVLIASCETLVQPMMDGLIHTLQSQIEMIEKTVELKVGTFYLQTDLIGGSSDEYCSFNSRSLPFILYTSSSTFLAFLDSSFTERTSTLYCSNDGGRRRE